MPPVTTILVADENPLEAGALTRTLRDAGYHVTLAAAAGGLVSQIRSAQPQLLLLSARWPGAPEFLRHVHCDPASDRLRVVLLAEAETAPKGPEDEPDPAADDYLRRPIGDGALLSRVRSQLRQAGVIDRLRASEEQFASAFAHAGIGMALVALDGRYLKVNRALCEILGYTEEELLARTFRDLTHPDDLDDKGRVQQLFAGTVAAFQMEKRYRHGKGGWVVGLLNVSVVRDAAGNPLHGIAQIQDITLRKQAEEQSRSSEKELRRIADELAEEKRRLVEAQAVAKVGSWETDVIAGKVRWSDETHRIFETDPARFHPTHLAFLQMVHPDDRVVVERAFADSLSERESRMIAHRLLLPNGGVKRVEERWRIFCNDRGEAVRAVGTCQDITERMEAAEQLRLSEERYRTLFERAPNGIMVSDHKGQCLDVNPAFCRMLGFTRHELLRMGSSDFLAHDRAPARRKASGSGPPAAEPVQECTMRRKDGSTFPAEILDTSMPDGNVLWKIRDLTARQEYEQEILRWSRLYAALSHVNQATVTSRTRPELFTTVCRALIQEGGFRIAWIGWLDPETSHVVPAGHWGHLASGVSHTKIFSHDLPEAPGSAAVAIREGKRSVSNNFLDDNGSGPWREIAAAAGIRAGAAFPIRENGEVRGAITVYSGEAGLFQDKEIGLLEEAAGAVSFGVDNLNREAARQRAEMELRAAERQLHSLVGRLHTVRENEAKRIARELHDDLGQKLTVLNMELANLEGKLSAATPAQLKLIERMRGVVDNTIEVVQKISGELRLGQLDVLGLTAAIDWHLKEFARQSGIACHITRLDETVGLPEIHRTTLFRILQETLTNVARHARATEVFVDLQAGEDEISLGVRDNGRGITAEELADRNSIGLLGMRERALLAGGTVSFTGRPGSGTEVRVRLPLRGPAAPMP